MYHFRNNPGNLNLNLLHVAMSLLLLLMMAVFSPLPGAAQKPVNMPEVKPLFEGALRDPSVCIGPDGTYYLTGTTANNPSGGKDTTGWWFVNEGIRIWKSRDLKKWEPLGLIWSLDKDATWAKEFKTGRGAKRRALWAPEIHYINGTFWLTYSMNYGGCGLLKSTTGKAEGPYTDVKTDGPLTNGRIDASLFQDDDGKVYFIYQNGLLARMKDDMTGFAEEPRLLAPANNKQVGFEGAFLTKYNGKYILICAESNNNNGVSTYDCMSAVADNIYGPYGDRYLAIPHGGHNMIFRTKEGKWMSTFFGSDGTAIFSEKPGILPIEFSSDLHFHPTMQTSAPENAQK
jgi:xylan 1,4-beta-xylosidase